MNIKDQRAEHAAYMRTWWSLNPELRAKANAAKREKRLRDPSLIREQERASRLRNREKLLARKARYRKENLAKVLEYNRKYNALNPEVMRKCREAYLMKHPHAPASWHAERRTREMEAMPSWVDRDALNQFYAQCAAITESTGIEHHVDHIVPLQGRNVCGLHVPWNLQILPALENCRKSNRFDVSGALSTAANTVKA